MQQLIKAKLIDQVNNNEGKKYLLFLLNSLNKKPVTGKTKLMKELFFISKNIPSLEELLQFEPDNYGPNSDVVNNYLDDMLSLNVVECKKKSKYSSASDYSITPFGVEILGEIVNENIDYSLLEDMKSLFDGLTLDEALALTYFTFPDTTEESLVKKRIVSNRKKLAIGLFKKDKISLEKATEISGISFKKFLDLLKKENISLELSI